MPNPARPSHIAMRNFGSVGLMTDLDRYSTCGRQRSITHFGPTLATGGPRRRTMAPLVIIYLSPTPQEGVLGSDAGDPLLAISHLSLTSCTVSYLPCYPITPNPLPLFFYFFAKSKLPSSDPHPHPQASLAALHILFPSRPFIAAQTTSHQLCPQHSAACYLLLTQSTVLL